MSVLPTTIMQPHPPNVSSPTLATPRPSSLNLKPQHRENGISPGEVKGVADGLDGDATGDGIDGRITPTADSHSNPSLASSSSSNIASPNPTTISLLSSSNSTNPPPTSASLSTMAEIGLGTLQCEDQLKSALQSKDRMFLLVLSKEIESFINRLDSGQISQESQPSEAQTQTQTQIPMVQLNASTTIGVTPTSKFQRMLVYKTAEWYGLKAVPGQDGGMIVGLLGEFNEKSTTLRLSELVPPAPSASSQTQKFRIMQRAPNRNGEASGSSSPAEGSSSGGTKWKTLEEREAAYAAAREKIYGTTTETGTSEIINEAIETLQNAQPPSQVDDEIDPVPRQLYQPFEVVYPSLYHPPKAEPPPPPPMNNASTSTNQYQSQSSSLYGYQSSYASYPQQIDANGYSIMPQAYGSSQPVSPQQPQQNYGMMTQTYMDPNQNGYMMPPQQNGYPVTVGWQQIPQQNNGYPNQMLAPNQQSYGMIPQQQNGINVPQGWQYPPPNQMMSNPPQQQQQQQQQMMPMISQGVPYPTSYGYPPQTAQPQPQPPIPPYRQGSYPSLVQPTPVRPPMQPHSSASSSISSRSYQDGSRPHSRGSTTSTRSAASSVRLGAMYPATQGPGYRQRAMKGQGMNGLTSLGLGNGSAGGMENKRNRGQSPSSTTTTSSRSSRRTSSIQLAPPTSAQHQLPQKPDWAANNVPYHPTPLPDPITPNAAEFPPLLRQDQGTNAEPMQVERAKMKPVGNGSGSVWNGTMVKNIHHHHQHQSPPHLQGNDQQQTRMIIVPPPTRTPLPTQQPKQDGVGSDPDFPRRLPTKTQPVLYDPSSSGASRPSSVNTHKSSQTQTQALSPEEIIEAKLAQISINNGIPIGCAPSTSSRGGDGKSYAKVVRRD